MLFTDIASVVAGLIVGFVLGLIGGGGSVFATPLLVYFVGVSAPHIAIGTGATAIAANALSNLVGHARAKNVRWKCAAVFAVAGVFGSLGGFFGIGGGFLAVPRILAATGMPMICAIGSSLVCVAVFGAATAGNYAISGLVDWRIAALLLLGGVFGGALARNFAKDRRLLQKFFAAMIAGVCLYVIYRGGLALLA